MVPDEITVDDLSDLELFLTPDEVSQVSSAYGAADDAGVRSFIGSEDDRRALEGFLGQAEMLVFQLDKGIASDQLLESMGADAATALGARPAGGGRRPPARAIRRPPRPTRLTRKPLPGSCRP